MPQHLMVVSACNAHTNWPPAPIWMALIGWPVEAATVVVVDGPGAVVVVLAVSDVVSPLVLLHAAMVRHAITAMLRSMKRLGSLERAGRGVFVVDGVDNVSFLCNPPAAVMVLRHRKSGGLGEQTGCLASVDF